MKVLPESIALTAAQQEAVQAAGLVAEKVEKLLQRAGKEVQEGILPAAQLALARHGRVVVSQEYGKATADSLFCLFSSTKALTSTAAWLLIEDGALDPSLPVYELVPEFSDKGKNKVTIEQLFTHTCGFPSAPFPPLAWEDKITRRERLQKWRLNWEPGSRFEYHPSSSMYVIADIIERITDQDWRGFVRQRILEPLQLHDLYLGLPPQLGARVLPCEHVGALLTAQDYRKMGVPQPAVTEVTEATILAFNNPDVRAVGVPGAGAIAGAGSLALFYQALLRDGDLAEQEVSLPRIWQAKTIRMGLQIRTGTMPDPTYGKAANRALGLIIAGDKARNYRGFGHTNSADAFGHGGAGGQIAWADPASGLSFAYCTNGHDRNPIRQGRRSVSLSSLAADCL